MALMVGPDSFLPLTFLLRGLVLSSSSLAPENRMRAEVLTCICHMSFIGPYIYVPGLRVTEFGSHRTSSSASCQGRCDIYVCRRDGSVTVESGSSHRGMGDRPKDRAIHDGGDRGYGISRDQKIRWRFYGVSIVGIGRYLVHCVYLSIPESLRDIPGQRYWGWPDRWYRTVP